MKYYITILILILATGCFPVRHCKNCTFLNGVINNTKEDRKITLPHWNDSVLVFTNKGNTMRDTFYVVKKKIAEVDKGSFQIENSSKDYLKIELSLRRKKDGETFRLYFGQYTCADDVLKLNISVLDFWEWATLSNNIPGIHSNNQKINQILIGENTYKNIWLFQPNIEAFPVALNNDVQKIFWHVELGLLQYESKTTGIWYREAYW